MGYVTQYETFDHLHEVKESTNDTIGFERTLKNIHLSTDDEN